MEAFPYVALSPVPCYLASVRVQGAGETVKPVLNMHI